MAVSPFKATYDPLTLPERLAAAYEAMDKILALGQSNNLRANELQRAKLKDLQGTIDWLESKIAALNPSGAFNLIRFRSPASRSR